MMNPSVATRTTTWVCRGFAAPSAAHAAKPMQDAILSRPAGGGPAELATVAVCDGHGHAKHFRSGIGSKVAATAAVESLSALMKQLARTEVRKSMLPVFRAKLAREIYDRWQEIVARHAACEPFPERRLGKLTEGERSLVERFPQVAYGSTMLAASFGARFGLLVRIGDGVIACCNDAGETQLPFQEAEKQGPQTASLSLPNAVDLIEVRLVSYGSDPPPAFVALASDGYPDAVGGVQEFLRRVKVFHGLMRDQGVGGFAKELARHLQDEQGSLFDDTTIGLLIRSDFAAGRRS